MPMFPATQAAFTRALLDPGLAPPPNLRASSASATVTRFNVYRNNVVAGLINALRARFPAVERIVGEDLFAVAARLFVAVHPPRSRLLMTYGDGFAEFLAGFEPLADLPYVPDVARLEAARTRAYHAADAMPLDAQLLRSIAPDRLWNARLSFHSSFELVRSRYPIVTIWAMNADEAELAPVDFDRAEDALVIRPEHDVQVRALPLGGAAFLLRLHADLALGPAAEGAMSEAPDFDLIRNLAGLIGSGVVTQIRFDHATEA
jgi:hypothetical protein